MIRRPKVISPNLAGTALPMGSSVDSQTSSARPRSVEQLLRRRCKSETEPLMTAMDERRSYS
jgi:hypothetical protein